MDLEKAEEPENKLPTSVGSQQIVKKFLKRWEYQTIIPVSWETCIQVKKQQLEPDMQQQTVPNGERSTSRVYIVTLLI